MDLRHHHPDLMERDGRLPRPAGDRAANLTALDREIRPALEIAGGQRHGRGERDARGVRSTRDYVRQSCESGAHAIVVGAGLPFDLPD